MLGTRALRRSNHCGALQLVLKHFSAPNLHWRHRNPSPKFVTKIRQRHSSPIWVHSQTAILRKNFFNNWEWRYAPYLNIWIMATIGFDMVYRNPKIKKLIGLVSLFSYDVFYAIFGNDRLLLFAVMALGWMSRTVFESLESWI